MAEIRIKRKRGDWADRKYRNWADRKYRRNNSRKYAPVPSAGSYYHIPASLKKFIEEEFTGTVYITKSTAGWLVRSDWLSRWIIVRARGGGWKAVECEVFTKEGDNVHLVAYDW